MEAAGVRGDRDIRKRYHIVADRPVLGEPDHVREQARGTGHVLVAPTARDETELPGDRVRPGGPVGTGPCLLLVGGYEMDEPPRHAAPRPGNAGEHELERPARQCLARGGMDFKSDLHTRDEQRVLYARGEVGDRRVGQEQLVAAFHEGLLHQREDHVVAGGHRPRRPASLRSDVLGGQSQSAVGHEVQDRHGRTDAVAGTEAAMVVAPLLVAIGMRRDPVQRRDGGLRFPHDRFGDLDVAVQDGVDEQRRRRDRREREHPLGDVAQGGGGACGFVTGQVGTDRDQGAHQFADALQGAGVGLLQLGADMSERVHGGHRSPQAGDQQILREEIAQQRIDLPAVGLREQAVEVVAQVAVPDGLPGRAHGGSHRPCETYGYLDRGHENGMAVRGPARRDQPVTTHPGDVVGHERQPLQQPGVLLESLDDVADPFGVGPHQRPVLGVPSDAWHRPDRHRSRPGEETERGGAVLPAQQVGGDRQCGPAGLPRSRLSAAHDGLDGLTQARARRAQGDADLLALPHPGQPPSGDVEVVKIESGKQAGWSGARGGAQHCGPLPLVADDSSGDHGAASLRREAQAGEIGRAHV